jgi:hypothetical protein
MIVKQTMEITETTIKISAILTLNILKRHTDSWLVHKILILLILGITQETQIMIISFLNLDLINLLG